MPDDLQISSRIEKMMAQEAAEPVAPSAPIDSSDLAIANRIQKQMAKEQARTLTGKVKGFGEAIVRGALTPLGAVALETKVLGVPKEEYAARQEELSGVAEFVGQGIGILAPTIVTGGSSLVGRLGGGALVRKLGLSSILNAEKAVALTKALNASTYLQAAGNVAARKATSDAAKKAIAMGIEGAIYAGGDPIAKRMLSDNPEDAMTTASSAVIHALGGGIFGGGLGYGVTKVAPIWKAKFGAQAEKAVSEVLSDEAALTTSEAINAITDPAEKSFLKKALAEQMPGKAKFLEDARRLGIPVTDAMTSESKYIHQLGGSLIKNPTFVGLAHTTKYDKGFQRVNQIVKDALRSEVPEALSDYELGDLIFNTIEPKIRKTKEASNALYDAVRSQQEFIPVETKAIKKFADQIKNMERVIDSPTAPASVAAKGLANDLITRAEMGNYSVKNLENQIGSIYSRFGKSAEEGSLASELKDLLENLKNEQVDKFASQMMVPQSEAQMAIDSLRAEAKAAKEFYAPFRDNITKLADVLGMGEVRGPSDFLVKFQKKRPEQIINRLSAKNNVRGLKFMQKEFPQELNLVLDHEKQKILKKFSGQDTIRSAQAIKEIEKLPKELKNAMFTPQQLEDLKVAQLWLERAAKLNINPSGSGARIAFSDYFSGRAAIMTVGDVAKASLIRAYTSGAQPSASAFKATADYLMNANQGALILQNAAKGLINGKEVRVKKSSERQLDSIDERAKQFLTDAAILKDKDEELSIYSPDQYQAVKTMEARVLGYLNSQRPTPKKVGMLGKEYPPSPMQKASYKRTLEIADQPLTVLTKIQNGSVTSKDIADLNAMYPELKNEMMYELLKNVSDKMKKNQPIPFKLRKGLSLFGATPLDASFTPQAIQAAQSIYIPKNLSPGQTPQMAPKSQRKSQMPSLTETEQQRRARE